MSDDLQTTSIGNLDPKLASALCYVPLMYINLLASLAFFFTEKEIKPVRYHAAQGLLFVGASFVGGVVYGLVYVVIAIGGAVADGILGTDGLLSLLLSLVMLLLGLVLMAVVVLYPFFLAYKAYSGSHPRVPIIGGLAQKIAGLEPGWEG